MKLLYLSRSRFGGGVTFTTHLFHGLQECREDVEVIRITKRTENTQRNMGNEVPYRNVCEEDVLNLEQSVLITASDKWHRELTIKLLARGAKIVIHDPTELRNPEFRSIVDPKQVIVIRKSMLEHMPEATYIPHPYLSLAVATGESFKMDKDWSGRKHHAINIARLDFDKNSHWLFEANRKLPEEKQVIIRGCENRMYTKTKILPKYPEYVQDSKRPKDQRAFFTRELRGAVNLCKQARYMTDFSVIHGDGGGTQYTFLEAMDAGTICLIHKDWIRPHDSMVDEGEAQNCISFPDHEKLVNFLNGKIDMDLSRFICTNAKKLLEEHDALKIAKEYQRELGKV